MRKRLAGSVLFAAALAMLAGCGDAPQSKPSARSASSSNRNADSKVLATAEEVAKEARGKVRCPPKIATAPRGKDAPVDDVLGVRPGMTYEEASNTVMCSHDLLVVQADTSRRFNINTYGQTIRQGFSARFAEERVHKDSRDYMREMSENMMARANNAVRHDLKPGQSKWYVSTIGLPGQERVLSVAREEWFEEGRNPTRESVGQALVKKYGQPTYAAEAPALHQGGTTIMGDTFRWAYDTFGRPIRETSPLYHQCRGNPRTDGGANYSPDCGVVIEASVTPMPDNPALVRSLQVGVIDQAGGYEAITGTEQLLAQQEAQRRAREVEDASRNAVAPAL